ncbi:hypothetical protein LUZ63_009535 [Rhynchospora breviuscula]|uniref:SWIM-type domain-containing protein n=1 Tax=Rhynchospora breviuscula TaxID=2022672 RepID=A0A9Q0CF70_9POAL|nr:hypothetical protein LUZ63_009535 [Rhynchospora breviuscula]
MKDMEGHEDDFVPRLGMEYRTLDEAWSVWNDYGGRNGFGVRRGHESKSKTDGVITSKFFLCNCEGKRGLDKRDHLTRKPRAETRTGCQARLVLKFDRGTKKYKVVEFVSEHNHLLQPPEACYLIPSQRKVSEIAGFDIQVAASSGIQPKYAHELYSRQHGGIRGVGYTLVDHRNCLRNIRQEALQYGSAIAMMKYFAKRSMEDSSFKHLEDTTEEGEIANVVWMDAKMIVAYARFGDVVIFDTTFGTNNEKYEEEKEFEDAFNILMGKVDGKGKEWLEVLEDNREKEIKSEYNMRSKLPRLKFGMPILREAANLYTPKVFELFQAEVELSMSAHIECLEGNTYTVVMYGIDNEALQKRRQVVWTRENQMISCSCKKFERVGILCWHALKVLVFCEDIKVMSPRYVLNRWTKAAKDVTIVDIEGRRVIEDPMLDVRNRRADLLRIVAPICDKAAYNEEKTHFVRNRFLEFRREYEGKYDNLASTSGNDHPTSEHSLHLKKNGGNRRSKRIPSCIEKKRGAKKAKNKTISKSQDSLRTNTNLSQEKSKENFGYYHDLEDL